MATQKFRPYFTYSELQEIIAALKSQPTPTRQTLIRYLHSFIAQIDSGTRQPNHILQPTLPQRLELESADIPIPLQISGHAAYQKWLINPASATPHEIAAAQEYRYLNDLMSADEESAYEHSQGVRA